MGNEEIGRGRATGARAFGIRLLYLTTLLPFNPSYEGAAYNASSSPASLGFWDDERRFDANALVVFDCHLGETAIAGLVLAGVCEDGVLHWEEAKLQLRQQLCLQVAQYSPIERSGEKDPTHSTGMLLRLLSTLSRDDAFVSDRLNCRTVLLLFM